VETRHQRHPASWWAQFVDASDRFDPASVTEGLSDQISPKIGSALLRREAEIAAELMVRHLNKPASRELADRAREAAERLVATVRRLEERTTADDAGTAEAVTLCHVLQGRYAEAASEIEPLIGTLPLLKVFVHALRQERLDPEMTLRLIKAGQRPEQAVRSAQALSRYSWWPSWLLKIVTDRAVAGNLDEETIAALDQCAYADLSPAQARVARRLLSGDDLLIEASADRLEGLGEAQAAAKLREGDLTAVALAARLIPI